MEGNDRRYSLPGTGETEANPATWRSVTGQRAQSPRATGPISRQRGGLAVSIGLIFAVCGLVFFTSLGKPRLWDRDEPRNAGCAAEMLERGDWVVPIFNDQLRHQKPVLLYWIIMLAYSVLGESEFSARVGSALLSTGTVLLTFALGSMLYSRAVGLWSAVILCTTMMFGVAARAATPDATLIFLMTLGLTLFVASNRRAFAGDGERGIEFPRSWFWVMAFFIALALAVLAKGLAGFVIPMAVVGLFLLLERLPSESGKRTSSSHVRRVLSWPLVRIWHPLHFWKTLVSMRPILGVLVVLAVAGPWYAWVGYRTDGEFLRKFFVEEHFGRATQSFENHSGGLWYYPLAIMLGFFPWSILTLPVGLEIDRDRRDGIDARMSFLLCWVAVIVGLFSLVATKLPSYVTPSYPALAIIVGVTVDRFSRGATKSPSLWFRLAFLALLLVALPVAGGLFIAARQFLHGHWELVWLAMPLAVGGGIGWWMAGRDQRQAAVLLGLTAVAFTTMLWGWGTVVVDSARGPDLVWERVRSLPAGTPVATYRCLESSWVVYGEHPIFELSPESPREGEDVARAKTWMPWPRVSPESFTERFPDAAIVTTDEHLDELRQRLPRDYFVETSSEYFLRQKRLVLLRRAGQDHRLAEQEHSDRRDR